MKAQSTFKPAQRTTLSEDICQQLVISIAAGELPPGSKLPSERELMDMFSVGRSSVREALRALTLVGLIETRQGYGACVASQSGKYLGRSITWNSLAGLHSMLEIVETRKVIESGVVRLVATRATEDDINQLEQQMEEMLASLEDVPTFAELDVDFHTTLAEIAGNRLLSQFIVSLRNLVHQSIVEDLQRSSDRASLSLRQHREIVDAIKLGDPELASQAMGRHLQDVSGQLLSRIGNGHPVDGNVDRTDSQPDTY
jgi:GntR family transcriptional repressor for pyruvate dehydrogenase complex